MITKNVKNIGIVLSLQAVATITIFSFTQPLQADTITKSGNGIFITEDFSCKVAIANYRELHRILDITPRTDFKYKIFLSEYEAVTSELKKHTGCKNEEGAK